MEHENNKQGDAIKDLMHSTKKYSYKKSNYSAIMGIVIVLCAFSLFVFLLGDEFRTDFFGRTSSDPFSTRFPNLKLITRLILFVSIIGYFILKTFPRTDTTPPLYDNNEELFQQHSFILNKIDLELKNLRILSAMYFTVAMIFCIISVGYLFEKIVLDVALNDGYGFLNMRRIFTAISIDVIAFIFFQMYRSNQKSIRYYNNEITSIWAKYIALKYTLEYVPPSKAIPSDTLIAVNSTNGKPDLLYDILIAYVKTDRNALAYENKANKLTVTDFEKIVKMVTEIVKKNINE